MYEDKLRGKFLTEPIKKLAKYFGGFKKVRIFAKHLGNRTTKWWDLEKFLNK